MPHRKKGGQTPDETAALVQYLSENEKEQMKNKH